MNTTVLRGVLLSTNLILVGIVVWISYLTFFHTDENRWHVSPPTLADFNVPVVSEDPAQRDRALYRTIVDLFEVKAPPKEVVPVEAAPVVVDTPVKPPIERITVVAGLAFDDDTRGAKNMVILLPPGGGAQAPFTEGMNLSAYPSFSKFPNTIVKEITSKEVIFTDKDGKELGRISGKPASKGGR